MIDSLHYAFMQRALIAGVLVGGLCAVIGVYVVLKGMSFIGAGISHASFGGVAIGVALGQNPIWSAVVFCLLTAVGIGVVSRRAQVKEDTAVGVFFASTMALGILLIGLMKSYQIDLFGYLFGSITSVTGEDLWTILFVSAAVIGCIVIFYKDLMYVVFDHEMARISGLPADSLYLMLICLMALTIVISIKIVGITLVSALIVTPAAAAHQLTDSFRRMMALSVAIGVGSCIAGLMLADALGVASGGLIVLLSTAVFFICAAISPKRRERRAAKT